MLGKGDSPLPTTLHSRPSSSGRLRPLVLHAGNLLGVRGLLEMRTYYATFPDNYPGGRDWVPHFIDGETEAPRGCWSFPASYN